MKQPTDYTFNKTCQDWLSMLIEDNEKSTIDELTIEEIKEEISDVKCIVRNERRFAFGTLDNNCHEINMLNLEEYLEALYAIKGDKMK